MGRYDVLGPVAYVDGDKVVHHKRPASNVEIDDKVAAELGSKVRKVESAPKVEKMLPPRLKSEE